MKKFLAKIHWTAVVGIVTTLAGLVSLPEVSGLLPGDVATKVIAAGAVIQAVTKAIHSKGEE